MHLAPRVAVTLLLATAAIFPITARAQDYREVRKADAYAQPLLVVQPRFPSSTPENFSKVEITLSGTIGANGKIRNATTSAPPGHGDFEKDVLEVAAMWRFIPAVDYAACAPVDAPGKVVVTFQIVNGKREILVTVPEGYKHDSSNKSTASSSESLDMTMQLARRVAYPEEALRTGATEGYVIALAQVAKDASLKKSSILAATPTDNFSRAVLRAVNGATFGFKANVPADKDMCIWIPFSFCFSGPADISMDSTCRR